MYRRHPYIPTVQHHCHFILLCGRNTTRIGGPCLLPPGRDRVLPGAWAAVVPSVRRDQVASSLSQGVGGREWFWSSSGASSSAVFPGRSPGEKSPSPRQVPEHPHLFSSWTGLEDSCPSFSGLTPPSSAFQCLISVIGGGVLHLDFLPYEMKYLKKSSCRLG